MKESISLHLDEEKKDLMGILSRVEETESRKRRKRVKDIFS